MTKSKLDAALISSFILGSPMRVIRLTEELHTQRIQHAIALNAAADFRCSGPEFGVLNAREMTAAWLNVAADARRQIRSIKGELNLIALGY